MSWKQVKQHEAYLLLYEKENGISNEESDQQIQTAYTEAQQPTDAWITCRVNELGDLLQNQKVQDYREDTVYFQCLLKQEATKLSHTHMVKLAKNRLKLLGGTSLNKLPKAKVKNGKNTDTKEECAKSLYKSDYNVTAITSADNQVPNPSLRKIERPDDPDPKRRKTIKSSTVAESSNKPGQRHN